MQALTSCGTGIAGIRRIDRNCDAIPQTRPGILPALASCPRSQASRMHLNSAFIDSDFDIGCQRPCNGHTIPVRCRPRHNEPGFFCPMNMPIGVIPEIGMMWVASARSTRRAKPAAVKGEPRYDVNTKADGLLLALQRANLIVVSPCWDAQSKSALGEAQNGPRKRS